MIVSTPNPAEPPEDRAASVPDRLAFLGERNSGPLASKLLITIILVLLVLAGLPVAVWLDMRNLSERALSEQADELSSMIDSIRNYYAANVVGRVLTDSENTHVLPNYTEVPGAIPIPATLSLELGDMINRSNTNTQFRFFFRLSLQKSRAACVRRIRAAGAGKTASKSAIACVRDFRLDF